MLAAVLPLTSCVQYSEIHEYHYMEFRHGDSPVENGSFAWTGDRSLLWERIKLPQRPEKKSSFLWYRLKVNTKNKPEAILTSGIRESVEVYCGSRKIYSFGSIGSKDYRFPGYRWYHLIPLPEKTCGEYIYFRCFSPSRYIGISSVQSSDTGSLFLHIINSDIGKFLLGILYISIAFIALVYVLLTRRRRKSNLQDSKQNRLFFHFIVFAFSIGIAVITDSRIKEFILNAPLFWIYIRMICLYAYFISILGFASHVFETRYINLINFFYYGLIALAGITIGFSMPGIFHLMDTIPFLNISILVLTPVGLFIIVTSNLKNNRDTWLFLAGTLILAATAIKDSLVDLRILPKADFIQHWGTLAFVLSLGIIFIRRSINLNSRYSNYLQEMDIAGSLVNSIMPDAIDAPGGMKISTLYIPMESIGGDFYDYFSISEKKIGVFICDVSGHGIPAALVSSMVKIIFDHQEHSSLDPSLLLSNINKRLLGRVETNFVTASYMLIDIEEKKCLLGNAGHPPLIVVPGDNSEIKSYRPMGRFLGQFNDINAGTMEIDIHAGDRILLYTDGITEVQGKSGTVFGDDQWYDFIQRNRNSTHNRFFSNLKDELKDLTETSLFSDDVTIILIDID